jgi:4-hydroxymandelate oxidase
MDALSLRELESEARRRLDPAVYDFFAGGADDEITLRSNETAFARIGLVPRVLRRLGDAVRSEPRDVLTANIDLEVTLLGCRASMPVLVAPTAFHRLAHPDGECATARAAAAAGTIMVVSAASTTAIEDTVTAARAVSNAGAQLWFQLYIQPDLGFTEAIIRRAEAAGCSALVITVDSPAFGRRERDLRNGFVDLPAGMCCENMREPLAGGGFGRAREIAFFPGLSWEHIDWLRKKTALKIVLKGVMHPEDAHLALRHGVNGLLISNHGGRQLDTVLPAIELLPPIADAVGGSIPLLVDGGIRRGTDVVKAIALGASAVAIGRPVLWGLAAEGEKGVAKVLELLRSELERALTLCGCSSPRDLSRALVRVRPTEDQRCRP